MEASEILDYATSAPEALKKPRIKRKRVPSSATSIDPAWIIMATTNNNSQAYFRMDTTLYGSRRVPILPTIDAEKCCFGFHTMENSYGSLSFFYFIVCGGSGRELTTNLSVSYDIITCDMDITSITALDRYGVGLKDAHVLRRGEALPLADEALFIYQVSPLADVSETQLDIAFHLPVDSHWKSVTSVLKSGTASTTFTTQQSVGTPFHLIKGYTQIGSAVASNEHRIVYASLQIGAFYFNSPAFKMSASFTQTSPDLTGFDEPRAHTKRPRSASSSSVFARPAASEDEEDTEGDSTFLPPFVGDASLREHNRLRGYCHVSDDSDISDLVMAPGAAVTVASSPLEFVLRMFQIFWHARNCDGKAVGLTSTPCNCARWIALGESGLRRVHTFMDHFQRCPVPRCDTRHCNLVRNVLEHFYECETATCRTCHLICQGQRRLV